MALSQSPTNLMISVAADTGKAIADLRKLQLELKNLNKELTAATKAGDDARAQALGRQIDTRTRQYNQLSRAIKETTGSLTQQTAAIGRTSSAFDGMGRNVGVALGGVRAMRFGFAGLAAALATRAVTQAAEQMNELNTAAKATGFTIQRLTALRQSFREAGRDPKEAVSFAESIARASHASRLKGLEEGAGSVDVLRGNLDEAKTSLQDFQTVVRGGQHPTLDWTDPFRTITGHRAGADVAKNEKELAQGILAIKDATLQNEAAQRIFSKSFAEVQKQLTEAATGTGPQGRQPTKAQADAQEALNKAYAATENILDRINEKLLLIVGSTIKAAGEAETWKKVLESSSTAAAESGFQPPVPQPLTLPEGGASAPLPPRAAGGYISGPGSGTSDSILARLSNGEFVINAASAERLGSGRLNRLNRFAGGGYAGDYTGFGGDYTGFGGGDPDAGPSLSSKVQVARAIATLARDLPRRGGKSLFPYGANETDEQYFARTGYHYGARGEALSQMLSVDPRETKLGGNATEVHLHVGTQEFSLYGGEDVVSKLVQAANSQRMRSAGTKPSWFGSRAGGR